MNAWRQMRQLTVWHVMHHSQDTAYDRNNEGQTQKTGRQKEFSPHHSDFENDNNKNVILTCRIVTGHQTEPALSSCGTCHHDMQDPDCPELP